MPRRPDPMPPQHFPVIATIAPVVASIAIWVITQSPFAIVFALLGPVIALASLGDSRRQGRKHNARERENFLHEVDAAQEAIREYHENEVAELELLAPSALRLLALPPHDPERWRGSLVDRAPIRIGTGRVLSDAQCESGKPAYDKADTFGTELEGLRNAAQYLIDAPIVVDARHGFGVCGPLAVATAAANAVVVQLASAFSPEDVELVCRPSDACEWLTLLPQHAVLSSELELSSLADLTHEKPEAGRRHAAQGFQTEVRTRRDHSEPGPSSGPSILVAVAEHEHELPRECRIVVRLDRAGTGQLIRHPQLDRLGPVRTEFVSEEQARDFAMRLTLISGTGDQGQVVPQVVSFSELDHFSSTDSTSLNCSIGIAARGVVAVDLVTDGPHAVIGGTTGSGKSELLLSWVLAMAARVSPKKVNFLLVDFKGGSSFAVLEDLPHSVGLVTDLDETAARRAILSLRAELRYRERILAECNARSITELPDDSAFPRLVIVVDEFQALTAMFPELDDLFVDLSARGRSLGIHLILCAQRPAGALRDAVLANCALRISLKVNNRADSVAVVGSAAAAELPRRPAGRAILSNDLGETTLLQLALAGEQDVARVVAAWEGSGFGSEGWKPRRPWLDPLPMELDARSLPLQNSSGIPFGLVDIPESQQQTVAEYNPERDGNLVVVGGRMAGKSGLLEVLAARDDSRWIPTSVEGAWDTVTAALAQVRSGALRASDASGSLLLLDDLDVLIGRFPQEHEQAFLEALSALLREGSRSRLNVVVTASRIGSVLQSVSALCDSKLILRMADRQEHLLAGGAADVFDPSLSAGGGHWRSHRVQIARAGVDPRRLAPPPESYRPLTAANGVAVISAAPQTIAERLGGLGRVIRLGHGTPVTAQDIANGSQEPRILLGDPDAWQAEWGLLSRLRSSTSFAFHACTVAEFRAITHIRTLPPPIVESAETMWLLSPDGSLSRATLPQATLP